VLLSSAIYWNRHYTVKIIFTSDKLVEVRRSVLKKLKSLTTMTEIYETRLQWLNFKRKDGRRCAEFWRALKCVRWQSSVDRRNRQHRKPIVVSLLLIWLIWLIWWHYTVKIIFTSDKLVEVRRSVLKKLKSLTTVTEIYETMLQWLNFKRKDGRRCAELWTALKCVRWQSSVDRPNRQHRKPIVV